MRRKEERMSCLKNMSSTNPFWACAPEQVDVIMYPEM